MGIYMTNGWSKSCPLTTNTAYWENTHDNSIWKTTKDTNSLYVAMRKKRISHRTGYIVTDNPYYTTNNYSLNPLTEHA